jgi:PAP2 superfamily
VITFPPYGEFARVYRESVNPTELAPNAWRPELAKPERERTWLEWRAETVRLITSTLWPQWSETHKNWLNPDFAAMESLTIADFDLFKELNASGVLDAQPTSPVAAASIPTHRQYFIDEDTAKLGDRYYFYDTTLPTAQLEKVLPDIRTALKEKTGSVSIQIKELLQRPRPYQVAKILGREHRFELATTSMTSSMSSGHCFQGCLVAVGIYETWIKRGFAPTPDQLLALAQYGVDIGDRRVFAGVHYPSDNLSSWIMNLRLVGEVAPGQQITKFLAKAIVERSVVFRLIDSSGAKAYAPALQLVKSLAAAAG